MKENYKLLKSYMELSDKFYSVTVTPYDISLQAYFDQHLIEKIADMSFTRTDEDETFIRFTAIDNGTKIKFVIEKN